MYVCISVVLNINITRTLSSKTILNLEIKFLSKTFLKFLEELFF